MKRPPFWPCPPWAVLLLGLAVCAHAAGPDDGFDYHLSARQIAPDVYAFIGAREDFTRQNGGNIVNTGFIVAPDGVIVIDTGPSLRYGRQMRAAIARVTGKPVALTLNTHAHPDHFFGNQAFDPATLGALPATQKTIASMGDNLAGNLYRLSGDWMQGTEASAPAQTLAPGRQVVAGRTLLLTALNGHTAGDLVVFDPASGVVFTGDLVFSDRAPTTPDADLDEWLRALDQLEALLDAPQFKWLVPGHGEPARNAAPLKQTRAWLVWLQERIRQSAEAGLSMNETCALPVDAFADMPLARSEYRRSVERYFPAAEIKALTRNRAAAPAR